MSRLPDAVAHWVTPELLTWPADALPVRDRPDRWTWRLQWEQTASGGRGAADLALARTGVPHRLSAAHPQLHRHLALQVPPAVADSVADLLTGRLAVSLLGVGGRALRRTGVQVPLVIDHRYAAAAHRRDHGLTWAGAVPTFRVWAPTAHRVTLLIWPPDAAPEPADATGHPMQRDDDGIWATTLGPEARDCRYRFEVVVHAPSTGRLEVNQVTDPWGVALTLGSTHSVAVDLTDPRWCPAEWASTPSPPLRHPVDTTVYELHVRDYSMSDPQVPQRHRGSYLAFADEGLGRAHLRALAAAGLNTVHLLPIFDIATIEEDPARRREPAGDLAAYPPGSDQQQAAVKAVAGAYNWGYDPWHYGAPEGSYASSVESADGGARVAEVRTMVGALHADGLRVVLDQVFNHTSASGQSPQSVLDRVVPGYYHRLDEQGRVHRSTCCDNVATEHRMAERLMVDAVVLWARHYRVDGFRFDLMGHHSVDTMLAVRAALDELTVDRDGVDGRSIYLYGEGWDFGEVAGNALFRQATQGQLDGTGIGTFSDRLRDAVRGGGYHDPDPRAQGFGTGLAGDSTEAGAPPGQRAIRLERAVDLVQLGLAGNLAAYRFRSAATGLVVSGAEVPYGWAAAGYAAQPAEVVTYVDAHDNETLWDCLTLKLPADLPMADRIRMNTLCLATTALAQTPSFWHAGADLLRSKSLDRNSYDSGDWFNRLDWSGQDNGFGRGLPPAGDNLDHWRFQRPLLEDPRLKPTAEQVRLAAALAQDLLRIRFSTNLFRLGSAELICAKVRFPASGTEHQIPGVIVMHIDDRYAAPVDPALLGVLVVLNPTPGRVRQVVPGLAGAELRLVPEQARGSDPVVRETLWDKAGGVLGVPPRTVAVLAHLGRLPGKVS